MRVIISGLFFAFCAASVTKRGIVTLHGSLDTRHIQSGTCPEYTNVIDHYRAALNNFTIKIYKDAALRGNYDFVASPHSMWLTLAAFAEGADPCHQQQMFQLLSLPSDPCLRQKYYQIAATRFSFTADVSVVSTRALVIDEGVVPNSIWHNFVMRHSLLEVISAPIKYNPAAAANRIRQVVSVHFPQLNLRGNSVLLNTMDYNGLWNTAFADAVVKRAPFYNPAGQQIGAVDLMRVKRRVKMGYKSSLQTKVIELPIGTNGQYCMIIALVVGYIDFKQVVRELSTSIISEVLLELKDSRVPIDVAVPRFIMNTELDMKVILQDLGLMNLWTDPAATRYISDPPALPSSFVQRATVTLNNGGVFPPPPSEHRTYYGPSTNPEDSFWSEFIADRPFMFGLFDTETYTCLMAMMYTQPTYPK